MMLPPEWAPAMGVRAGSPYGVLSMATWMKSLPRYRSPAPPLAFSPTTLSPPVSGSTSAAIGVRSRPVARKHPVPARVQAATASMNRRFAGAAPGWRWAEVWGRCRVTL